MKMLDAQRVEKARNFVTQHARALDRTLLDFYLFGGSRDAVRSALQSYQDEDGGFGRAIEPDFRLDVSSPMATTVALQYAREIHLDSTDPVIQRAIAYLLRTFDPHQKRWHAVPAEINDVPHAPWWNYDVATGRCGVEETWANPNAEIVGYLYQYSDLVPQDFLDMVITLAMEELQRMPHKIELHDFQCYQSLATVLPDPHRSTILDKLRQSVSLTVAVNPAQWEQYAAKPIHIAASPDAFFAPMLHEAILANLDYEIDRMNEDGSWSPNWSWFGQYDEVWSLAEQEWKGHLTVKTLKCLHDYGRLAL